MKKNILKKLLALLALCSSAQIFPLVIFRSPTVDAAREMVGWTQETYLCCQDDLYGTFAFTGQYTRSMDSNRIAKCLLGNCYYNACNKPTINVTGSRVNGRGLQDWLADDFGLAPDFSSTVTLKPTMDYYLGDFNFYLGMDRTFPGMFFKMHIPIVHMRTHLNFVENVNNPGVLGYDAGYFAPVAVDRSNLLNYFQDFIGDNRAPTIDNDAGIIFDPLCKGRWGVPVVERLESLKLSEVEATWGYNFLLDCDYHLGAGLVVRAPTGSRVVGTFMFEPIIGNGMHWEVGGMLTSHYTFWRSQSEARALRFSLDAYLTHLFAAKQCRTFDLVNNGCSSRYMLAQQMGPQVNEFLFGRGANVPGGPTVAAVQPTTAFQGLYTSIANLTTLPISVKNNLQVDMAAMFTYVSNNQTLDIGYDFWFRSRDKICIRGDIPFEKQQWALKGDAMVYGFGATDAVISAGQPIALSASQSTATIHAGNNTPAGIPFIGTGAANQLRNAGIDNAQFATTSDIPANTTDRINFAPGLPAADLNQQRTSINPILLTRADIDIAAQEKQVMSHKVFAHYNYVWDQEECILPYFGFGGYVEFANTSNGSALETNNCSPIVCTSACANNCNCGLSQWSIWMKAGFTY